MGERVRFARRGTVRRRDPANDLYDRACDLVAAARALREAAGRQGGDAAVAATLGSVQSALGDVAAACRRLADASDRRLAGAEAVLGGELGFARERVTAEFDRGARALTEAAAAYDRARDAVGPLLGELTPL